MKHFVKEFRPETIQITDQLATVLDPVLCYTGMREQYFPSIDIFGMDDVKEPDILFEFTSNLFGPVSISFGFMVV